MSERDVIAEFDDDIAEWNYFRPQPCQPPVDYNELPTGQEETDVLEDISDLEFFSTAAESLSQCSSQEQDTELQNFIMAEMAINEMNKICTKRKQSDQQLPNYLNDEYIFRDNKGMFHKLSSAMTWKKSKSEVNRVDCALQISANELIKETSIVGKEESHVSHDCSAVDTSLDAEEYTGPNSKKNNLEALDSSTVCQLQTMRDTRDDESADGKSNFVRQSKSENLYVKETSSSIHTSVYDHKTVESLIEHIEDLLKNESDAGSEVDDCNINIPVQELSPRTKKEVQNFLKEATESFELSVDFSSDESQSSLQLLRSIIAELGKQYGFLESELLQPISEELSVAIGEKKSVKATDQASATKSKRSSHIPRLAGPSNTHKTSLGCHSSPLPESKIEKHLLPTVSTSTGKTHHPTRTPENKSRSRRTTAPKENLKITCNDIVDKQPCLKLSDDKLVTEFHSCKQQHMATRGVKAPRSKRRCQCIRKLLMKTSSAHRVQMPSVEQFTTSTKAGKNSFYEILRTKLNVPDNTHKKSIVGTTIPIPLQSEARWINGELSVQVKEIDKDPNDMSVKKMEGFTKMPHTISIDFVREHKHNKLQLRSRPVEVVKRPISCLAGKIPAEPHCPHNDRDSRAFNTKVDYIFKRDPLVLGTLDRNKLVTKSDIQRHKLKRTDIPVYCVV